ncbi:flagellar assembly peptidoglycan hydrolase FlgJ [Pontibacterium granulatum]|uniref:flagellar assembly peptidoglycan hydrolase FlgJ n=1 Tax=Pontibacterium granulatum TaxID=2036029 RepID=UPI00249AB5DA|nr:flagellar assembly peptidoglycan hydrolase FlgJ [Pontibacterium granulatum]MDI3322913.1 flagellar assembly peptidoglycan hydrolase FlgJ [Pontibacterium granulatum]
MNIKPTGGSGNHNALYTELNELNKISRLAKDDNEAALKQVAQQFEQVFMSMLMKSMREANESFGEDNFLNSSQTQFYEGMLDQQMTMELAQNGGMGLADVLVKQLSRQLDIPVKSDSDSSGKDKDFQLSKAERMLNRAFDTTGNIAASTMLSDAVTEGGEQRPQVPTELKAALSPAYPVAEEDAQSPTNIAGAQYPLRFDSPAEFVKTLMPLAESVADEIGVDPKVLLAQAALETGWGKHLIQRAEGGSSYNLFNIKADNRWSGDRVTTSTLEFRDGVAQRERANFRAYQDYEQSFRDYIGFLKGSPRYQVALQSAADPYAYLSQLQQAGYATDPNYAEKISSILDGDLLAYAASGSKEG